MPLSFQQLTTPKTAAQWAQILLNALAGLGIVVPSNGGTGTAVGSGGVSLSGTPNATYSALAVIQASGEPGTATVAFSLDGGATFGPTFTIPSNGQVEVVGGSAVDSAVLATFSAGPAGAGQSFVAGDSYGFTLSTPTFPVAAWQPGSVPRSLVAIDAQAVSSLDAIKQQIAAGGLALTATGPWADVLGQNVYNLLRNQAVSTVGFATLTDAASQGPFSVGPGDLLALSSSGQVYRNSTGGTLTKGGTLQLSWEDTVPGAAGNVGVNTIQTLSTPLPGVTINNPTVVAGTWITVQGADIESDQAYMSRCTARWPALAANPAGGTNAPPSAVYDLWARTADPSITRTVEVPDQVQGGQVDLFVAGSSGPAGGGAVTNAQNYINARQPLTTTTVVAAATGVTVPITGTVFFRSANTTSAAATTAVNAALVRLFTNFPLGKDGAGTVKLYLDQVKGEIEACMGLPDQATSGISHSVLSSPSGDTSLTTGQVPVLGAVTLSFVGV